MTDSEKRIPPFGLRLPSELKERVQEAARDNNRSMNAEIIARLERTFSDSAAPDGFDVRQEVKRHHSWMVMMMTALAQSGDRSFDPIRDLLHGMDERGRKAAAEWFLENEGPDRNRQTD